jgi:type IV pilus assembly protein PilZ
MGKGNQKPSRLVLTVTTSEAHQGKTLDVDREQETITAVGADGRRLGTIGWPLLLDYITATQPAPPEEGRTHPRASFLSKVRYRTGTQGPLVESRATGVGGGGLFIESAAPLSVGASIELEFTLPERASDWLKARGAVAWVCPKPDQYTFASGMGIRFTSISEDARARVLAFVQSLKRKDAEA